MIQHQFKYEWLQLFRERWVLALLVIFLGVMTYSVYNGNQKVNTRTAAIEKAKADMQKIDAKYAGQIDSLSKGLMPAPESWLDPRLLSVYGQRAPRVVSMDAQPLAFIAVGQSDLFTHYVKPKLYGEAYALGFSELANPVQLLFGTFDLAFVCIYLLPLLIIAFSYNLLSQEKESGVFRLTMAQPISLYGWLFSRTVLRFLIIAIVLLVSLVVAMLLNGVLATAIANGFLIVYFFLLLYAFFWFLVSLLINLFGKSSGQNAVALVSVWVALVLLLPSIISQTANTLYPVPSRINMINEYRVAEAKAEKEAAKMLKTYYRDHPELAPKDSTEENQYSFWLEYFATIDVLKQAVSPVLNEYNEAIAKQQAWVDKLGNLSPAIVLQSGLNEQAGTSPAHYASYREQVIQFASTWKGYFMPRMFRNETMKPEDLPGLPQFEYDASKVSSLRFSHLLVLTVFLIITVSLSVLIFYSRKSEQILTS